MEDEAHCSALFFCRCGRIKGWALLCRTAPSPPGEGGEVEQHFPLPVSLRETPLSGCGEGNGYDFFSSVSFPTRLLLLAETLSLAIASFVTSPLSTCGEGPGERQPPTNNYLCRSRKSR